MSNPAIVLMTDPSRCSLGDVQYLVQALREMQQMGEHAIPQAFCDHPEAARDFLDAYAHAYPQLVLEDREIPTPDHLHSLISTGQVGALGRPAELLTPPDLRPPAGLEGTNAFPIVMLTLGSSQALLDALQQAPTIRESIRLIDVAQERADAISVAVADVVASRDLGGEPSHHERLRAERPELDDVSSAAKVDLVSLALHDEQMNLDVLETVEASTQPAFYDQEGDPEPIAAAPIAVAAKPVMAAVEERPGAASPDDTPAGVTASATEVTSEPAIQPVVAARPSEPAAPGDGEALEPEAQSLDAEAPAPDDGSEPDNARPHAAGKGAGRKQDKKADKEVEAVEKSGKSAPEEDDDVYYPPVGTLLAGADVLYPALDRYGAHGALHDLASVLLDDSFLASDLAADFTEAQRAEGMPALARQDAIVAVRSGDKVVTLGGVYDACEQESDDQLADAGMTRPLHDSDL